MNRALPKVSVITITYGHEKYITETLDGVLMQQYEGPVELIIANDCSPDATDDVVKKYFSENPAPGNFEIKYTKHETNKGMMPNFIWALEQATGKYIALCEGDDYWTDPLKLQRQVDFLEANSEYIISAENAIMQDELRNYKCKFLNTNKNVQDITILELLEKRMFTTASVVFRKTDIPFFYGGDIVLWVYLLTIGMCHFNNVSSSVYRRGIQGVTENTNKYIWANEMYKWNKSLATILKNSDIKYDKNLFSIRNQKNYFISFIDQWVTNNKKNSLKSFCLSLYFQPIHTIKDLVQFILK